MKVPVSHKIPYIISGLLAVLMLVECSPRSGNALLQIFFDGVPEEKPKDVTQEESFATKALTDTSVAKALTLPLGQQLDDSTYYHPPFKEKACNACHINDDPATISHMQNKICYSCHQDYAEKRTWMHGPVASGECTACHFPHAAQNNKLLRREGQDLCYYCHEPAQVLRNKSHNEIGNASCTQCHDAHGSKEKYMIK